jgi:nucleoid-associated protein YgaU
MDTNDIIIEIDAQISRLLEAKALLVSPEITIRRKPGRPSRANLSNGATSSIPAKSAGKPVPKRIVSAEARAKMAAAQKARWAKTKRAAKKAARSVAATLAAAPVTLAS